MVTPRWWPDLSTARSPRRGERWLGLDLGRTSIKLVECEQTASGVRVLRHLIQELPQAAAGEPVDRVAWLQAALKECAAREAYVAVGEGDVVLQRVDVPPMSARELPEAVKWHVKDQLPFGIQDAVIDARVLGEVWDKDVKRQDVLVAAGAKPLLQQVLELAQRGGAQVRGLVPQSVAAWASVSGLMPEAERSAVAIVDLGTHSTQVVILKDGQVRLVRELPVGSATVTNAIVGTVASDRGPMTIDRDLAESLKRRYGVLTEQADGASEEGVPLFHLASLMRPVLEQLLTEVGRLLDFYHVQVDTAGVRRVLLCGGGGGLRGLDTFLTEGLGIPVDVFNPLARLTQMGRCAALPAEQIDEDGPRLAVAVGLALDRGRSMNLLRPELRSPAMQAGATVRAARVAAAVMLAAWVLLYAARLLVGWQLQRHQVEWAALEPTAGAYEQAVSQRQVMDRASTNLSDFLTGQPPWRSVWQEWAALIPEGLELDELRLDGARMRGGAAARFSLTGHLTSGSTSQRGLSTFVDALNRSVFFERVSLISSEMHTNDPGKTRFELEGQLE